LILSYHSSLIGQVDLSVTGYEGYEVYGTGSGLCAAVGFGIGTAER
jgi:hypothetical protein